METRTTYLERYLAGEYEQVWTELQALGATVYEEPLHRDALAVASETMRRVRMNLEMLIPRLAAIGYQFGYGWVQPPADEPFGWQLRRAYLSMVEYATYQPALLTVSADVEEHLAERQARLQRLRELGAPAIILQNEERRLAELEAQPRATELLRELEERAGVLPLSVRVVRGRWGCQPGWRPSGLGTAHYPSGRECHGQLCTHVLSRRGWPSNVSPGAAASIAAW